MTSLIRSITNTSSVNTLPVFIPGVDPANAVTVAPSATLDLLTVIDGMTLHAIQGQLNEMLTAGSVTVAASISSSAIWPAALGTYLASSDTQVVFNPTSGSATHTAGFTTVLQIESAAGAIDFLDSTTTVTVSAAPTGASVPLLNGHASPITVPVVSGVASILVTANIADTETLSITAVSRTLTHSSTCVVTLS